MKSALGLPLLVFGAAMLTAQAAPTARKIPWPFPDHPGNIFVVGESVRLAAPDGESEPWRAVDYEGRTIAEGNISQSTIDLGQLPVGYYEVLRGTGQGTNHISLGVLQPLRVPTPLSSPMCIDVAMSWFYPPEKMPWVANLCALAGMNRVRDRLAWQELEPRRGELVATNRYDLSAQAQSTAGLQVLQVNHSSPAWANPNRKRFPLDLRDIYNLHRVVGRRWCGQVVAFEPWNEADIKEFGGHTGSEMASLQKAAYLGLKTGNPNATACLNVFAIHRAATLRNFDDNEAWPISTRSICIITRLWNATRSSMAISAPHRPAGRSGSPSAACRSSGTEMRNSRSPAGKICACKASGSPKSMPRPFTRVRRPSSISCCRIMLKAKPNLACCTRT